MSDTNAAAELEAHACDCINCAMELMHLELADESDFEGCNDEDPDEEDEPLELTFHSIGEIINYELNAERAASLLRRTAAQRRRELDDKFEQCRRPCPDHGLFERLIEAS